MKFWDSSAVVPLVTQEAESARCRAWLRGDRVLIVWMLSDVEVTSALTRKHREGGLSAAGLRTAMRRLAQLRGAWNEVYHHAAVRERAQRLLAVHPLRAADALQLAAALVVTEERPRGFELVTFDARLAIAAAIEGFAVLGTRLDAGE